MILCLSSFTIYSLSVHDIIENCKGKKSEGMCAFVVVFSDATKEGKQ